MRNANMPSLSQPEHESPGAAQVTINPASPTRTLNRRNDEDVRIQEKDKSESGEKVMRNNRSAPHDILCFETNRQVPSSPLFQATKFLRELKEELSDVKHTRRQLIKLINEERAKTFSIIQKDLEEQQLENRNLADRMVETFADARKDIENFFNSRMSNAKLCGPIAKGNPSQTELSHCTSPSPEVVKLLRDCKEELQDRKQIQRQLAMNIGEQQSRIFSSFRTHLKMVKDENRNMEARIAELFADAKEDVEKPLDDRMLTSHNYVTTDTNTPSPPDPNQSSFSSPEIEECLLEIKMDIIDIRKIQRQLCKHINEERATMFAIMHKDLERVKCENRILEVRIKKLFAVARHDMENSINDILSRI